jgi:hypothetical protein
LAYDIKYILGNQPTFPSYENSLKPKLKLKQAALSKLTGLYEIGHQALCFDNELGKHSVCK